ncbi:hypothetical protein DPMN_103184 [Dreissena polymorpha]|uniref:Uncharacterized protein n=1 Tax=Dreissena polymorpha TaxID=45954 RepID=A0A9D4HDY2_DREPO|nr:hypothetical protein DPMN_103184 [Dreissena polymorpha]
MRRRSMRRLNPDETPHDAARYEKTTHTRPPNGSLQTTQSYPASFRQFSNNMLDSDLSNCVALDDTQ